MNFIEKKEIKSKQLNLLMRPSDVEKLKLSANKYETSVNDLLNQIIERFVNEENENTAKEKDEERKEMIEESNIKVYSTKDYSMFKFAEWNRKINNIKVNQLAESMSEVGYQPLPILVNEAYLVIDGQHRLKACEKIGCPVYYIVACGIGSKVCRRLNTTQQNWTTLTMIESFAKENADDPKNSYVRFKQLIDNYGEAIRTTLCAIKNYRASEMPIRNGTFTMNDFEFERAKKALEFVQKVKPYRHYFNNKDMWIYGLIFLYNDELIEEERMLKQLNDYGHTLDGVGSMEDVISGLNELYNYHMRQKIRFVDKWKEMDENR